MTTPTLPDLPEPDSIVVEAGRDFNAYTADQMRAYARQALSAAPDLQAAARMALDALESLQGGCTDSGDGTVEAITVWCPEVIEALRAALSAAPSAPFDVEAMLTACVPGGDYCDPQQVADAIRAYCAAPAAAPVAQQAAEQPSACGLTECDGKPMCPRCTHQQRLDAAAHAQPPALVADAAIKAMYVEMHGSDRGWLGVEGSYFISGVQAARTAQQQAATVQPLSADAAALLAAIEKLPTIKAPEIDGEESDGTPRYWRSRPYVSLTALKRLLSAGAATQQAPTDTAKD